MIRDAGNRAVLCARSPTGCGERGRQLRQSPSLTGLFPQATIHFNPAGGSEYCEQRWRRAGRRKWECDLCHLDRDRVQVRTAGHELRGVAVAAGGDEAARSPIPTSLFMQRRRAWCTISRRSSTSEGRQTIAASCRVCGARSTRRKRTWAMKVSQRYPDRHDPRHDHCADSVCLTGLLQSN